MDPPCQADPSLVNSLLKHAGSVGKTSRRMVSRAYHDCLFMALICPTTMLFIPCRNGYSHRPDEYSSPEQIASGVEVLALALRDWSQA
jgi:N-carbamoyl-L-amino-acid hydrolase